jgi:hypothetical protein
MNTVPGIYYPVLTEEDLWMFATDELNKRYAHTKIFTKDMKIDYQSERVAMEYLFEIEQLSRADVEGDLNRSLVMAICDNDFVLAKTLIQERESKTGKDVNAPLTIYGLTALMNPITIVLAIITIAMYYNDYHSLEVILQLGGNPNTISFGRSILLFTACLYGSPWPVEALVNAGANTDRKEFGRTMVEHAKRLRHTCIVKYLNWINRRAWATVLSSIKNVDSDAKIMRVCSPPPK